MTNPTDFQNTTTPDTETTHESITAPKTLPPQFLLKELCGDLARNLALAPSGEEALSEQIQILNSLFHATLAEQLNLTPKYGVSTAQGWLEIALKVQKQCMDAVRTQKNMAYMDDLRARMIANAAALPPPRKTVERSEENDVS